MTVEVEVLTAKTVAVTLRRLRPQLPLRLDRLGEVGEGRTVANWWHIACLDEHERWHEQHYGEGAA